MITSDKMRTKENALSKIKDTVEYIRNDMMVTHDAIFDGMMCVHSHTSPGFSDPTSPGVDTIE